MEALTSGAVERRTDTASGDEAIYRNGCLIAADGKEPLSPDLIETVKTEPHLFLFGAGHIAKALYDIAVLMGMRMTVVDDRPELLNAERFPLAERHAAPYETLLAREYSIISPYWVIFTHGHSFDTGCLRYALRHQGAYTGMIGSAAKAERTLNDLRNEGFPEDKLRAVHTPIGINIGAETPEEIAVSIMAEIISVYRGEKNTVSVDPALLRELSEREGIVVRIISKKGSAPRAQGAMMLVTESDTFSTIGGGALEQMAIAEAREMLKDGRNVLKKHSDLSAGGDIGMVCGGNADLLFKRTGSERS